MEITKVLFDNIMDDLFCVALSAKGGYPSIDEEGKPFIPMELATECADYARNTALSLLNEWEKITGKEWRVVGFRNQEEN